MEVAEQSLQEILTFIASAAEFRVSSPREFRNVFEESQTPETKALVTQVSGNIVSLVLVKVKRALIVTILY